MDTAGAIARNPIRYAGSYRTVTGRRADVTNDIRLPANDKTRSHRAESLAA